MSVTLSPPAPFVRRAARRSAAELKLTGLACWRGFVGFYNSDDMTFASSIAYYSLLSLFPFLLLAFSIIGSVAGGGESRTQVLDFVLRYFPTNVEFVQKQLSEWEDSRVPLSVFGSVLLVWASMGVFGAVTSAVNHAWGVEQQPSYAKHKLISFIMLVVASLLLLAGLLLISVINVSQARWFSGILQNVHWLQVFQGIAVRSATTILLIIVVGLIFYFVPNAKVRFRDVWVGAVLTGLLWRGAFAGFSLYVRESGFTIHGSVAAAVVFLLWIFVSAVILLYGVEVTAAYARLRRRRPEQVPAAPTPRL